MQTLTALHQFAVTYSAGDGITNGMLFIQRIARAWGLPSRIYVIDAEDNEDDVADYQAYQPQPTDLLLIHHGSGNPLEHWLKSLPCYKVLVYHNITPERFFSTDHPAIPVLRHGREQLSQWHTWLDGALADSEHNRQELLAAGFPEATTTTLPLLVDLARFSAIGSPPASELTRKAPDEIPQQAYQLLFVGRLAGNKNQAGLITTLAEMQTRSAWPVALTLVGGGDPATLEALREQAHQLGLADHVHFAGKVDDPTLHRHYQQADLYLSLSEHEGFGMPLIEAMAHDVPVVAYAAPDSSIADTVGDAGLLLVDKDPSAAAAAALMVLENANLRARLIAAQRERLAHFSPPVLVDALANYLAQLGLQAPNPTPSLASGLPPRRQLRIEGPFDSSYSLALVNREITQALLAQQVDVTLHSTEGGGDFAPDNAILDHRPGLAEAHRQAAAPAWYDAGLRLCYPPRTTELPGRHRLIHTYGWEESVFPHAHAQAFNARLSAVTTMSRYVSRVLADSGVKLPLPVTGVGTDHLTSITPDPDAIAPWFPAPQTGATVATPPLTFLHVSSCFPRKGVDVLLAAWAQAFTQADNVQLVIKTFPNPHHDIDQAIADWRAQTPEGAPVTVINQDLSAEAIRALYQQADVLVAPSRGEGFGLPMAEAMWCHLPVITTGAGGQRDFCTPETAWLIDYQFARAATHMAEFNSVWVEPVTAHLAGLMGEFYHHHQQGGLAQWVTPRCEAAYRLISQEHTWAAVARRQRQAVETLEHQPLLTPRPRIGWVSSWNSKCGIATYSRLLVSPALAGQVTVLADHTPARIAEDDANVVRCWRQIAGDGKGGYDEDPLDDLLHEIRQRKLEIVVFQFNFSFFGTAPLSALLETLHDEGIQCLVFFHSTADVTWGTLQKSLQHMAPALRRCARIMVHSVGDLNRLKHMHLHDNATLFPHGVMASPEATAPQDPRFQALADKTVIACYGFLLPHKGVHELIEAFAILADQAPQRHLLLLNALYPAPPSEEEAQRCKDTIARLGLEQRVTMINDFLPDEQTLGWLQAADLLVFPYQHTQESSSAAVRWGLASGKPVACTPLSIFDDVAEAVTWLPGTQPANMAEGIDALLNDPGARQALVHQAAHWVSAHDWARLSQRLNGLLTALARPPVA
ncbi:glycosyltransferase [Halomonas sp. CUBES01]|uniref:Glycosyltransferase n=1 Tax=Vreelandella gomseomensis TaxID=370766 RepID=A0ABU1GEU4_9GAMM|nr:MULTISPECIES: glycosyltransferase [Halomonas]MDR5876010.1 glycosyltransferase [Halomonas gomseomensis]MEC4766705.1 glycosyltransferase [Halomonas sp. CUBES01]